MKNQELLKAQKQEVCFLLSNAVGFVTTVCISEGKGNRAEFQFMPVDSTICEDFWSWHVENNEQWFDSPLVAAADFLQKYQQLTQAMSVVDILAVQ